MGESVGGKLDRVRAPRVHVTYEVEVGGAMVMKELPFVMGVLGEFGSNPRESDKKLKGRSFTEVNFQSFDSVLKDMAPTVQCTVKNRLSDNPNAGDIAVNLTFESMDDFAPDRVAEKIEPLRDILELRRRLADLRGSLQGNDALEAILQETMKDRDKMLQLKSELSETGGNNG